jgi:uncharacterized protein YbaR (Trm112 family)
MLSQDLLKILACPACKGEITPFADEDALFCQACKLKFPVREGIPVMLLAEAETVRDRKAADSTP